MKTKTASLILAAAFGVLTTNAQAWGGRPPIPMPGNPCPPTYHPEQVNRSGWQISGSAGASYRGFNGNIGFQSLQYTQQYQQYKLSRPAQVSR